MSWTSPSRILVLLAFVVVLGVPFLFRPRAAEAPADAARVIIITPHNEQIRTEFELAFDAWHREHYNQPAAIDWVQPGGTSEIRNQLMSVYRNAIINGVLTPEGELADADSPMPNDLLFGGGTYEHGKMKGGVSARPPGDLPDAAAGRAQRHHDARKGGARAGRCPAERAHAPAGLRPLVDEREAERSAGRADRILRSAGGLAGPIRFAVGELVGMDVFLGGHTPPH